jgi:uncharacterized membrane protein
MSVNYVKGQILSGNLERDGIDLSISNANVGINTLNPASALEIVGDVTVGNVVISNIGNITVGNVNINDLAEPVANTDAATKFYVDTVSGNITGIGNLEVIDTTITAVTANANISIDPTGTGTFVIVGTNGFVMPAGTTAERPATGNAAGTLRFNTDTARMEVYDGTEWDQVVGGVTSQTISTANGVTKDFNLDRKTTTAATLVMLNGVVQLPTTSYSITGAGSNVLTFVQAPVDNDIIDVRFL